MTLMIDVDRGSGCSHIILIDAMAMEVTGVFATGHEDSIVALAFNRAKKEIFSAAQGDKRIHVALDFRFVPGVTTRGT